MEATSGDSAPADAAPELLDPLSERELVVLSHLPTLLKAAEIAADLSSP